MKSIATALAKAVPAISGLLLLSGFGSAWALDPRLCSPAQPAECENGLSTPVTSLDALRVRTLVPAGQQRDEEESAARQASLQPVRLAALGDSSGLLAKETWSGWGLWASFSRADFAGTRPQVPYTSRLDSLSLGVDKSFYEWLTAGVVLIGEDQEIRTRYNYGGQKVRGYSLAPYASVLLNDHFSVDVNGGGGYLEVDQHRLAPDSAPNVPVYLYGNYRATRNFWTTTLNGFYARGDWTFGGRAGYLDSREEQPAYTERDPVNGSIRDRSVRVRKVTLTQLFGGVDAAWSFHRNGQLYASVLARRDLSRDSGKSAGGLPAAVTAQIEPSDDTETEAVVGIRFQGARGLTVSAEWLRTYDRAFFENDTFTLLGRIEF